jgi:putative endonuclease
MYILKCCDDSYYTGSTKNLEHRLAQHQAGEGANYTRKHLPVSLIYCEEYPRIDDAFHREKQVQGWSRKKKEALINGTMELLPELAIAYRDKGGFVASRALRQGSGTPSATFPLPEGVPEALEGSRTEDFANPLLEEVPEALEGSRTEDFANPLLEEVPEALEGSRTEDFANPLPEEVPEALEGSRTEDFANPLPEEVPEVLEGSRTEDFANPLPEEAPEALEGSRTEDFANPLPEEVPEVLEGPMKELEVVNE